MNQRTRPIVPAVVVAVALGLGSTLLVLSSGGASPAKPAREPAAACKPAPASCGRESLDGLAIAAANEAARRMVELRTTGTTTVTSPTP
jgi:hypothetical protein